MTVSINSPSDIYVFDSLICRNMCRIYKSWTDRNYGWCWNYFDNNIGCHDIPCHAQVNI